MTDLLLIKDDYTPEMLARARSTCLEVAVRLNDLMAEVRIVGGLVPTFLIPPAEGTEAHVGTQDLDVGLAMSVLSEERYKDVAARLREAGFKPAPNEKGNPSHQTWWKQGLGAKVDFLIPPTSAEEEQRAGKVKHLEQDFAAFIAPALPLAFQDYVPYRLEGETLSGGRATREIYVSGPGAFVILKACAYRGRAKTKDAYDLFYMLRNYGDGVEGIHQRLAPLLTDKIAQQGLAWLGEDFREPDLVGPRDVARFLDLKGARAAEVAADTAGFVRQLLRLCEGSR